ncbi:hypothetical protein OC834_005389 [Tilletia horrida]|nr:hypothetical protein OC834_005389 [Tilletia horrida]KAK0540000.1 hypothetical protein OC835_000883 [Tilletia horrida]
MSSSKAPEKEQAKEKEKCFLTEFEQFDCELPTSGRPRARCFAVRRIFRTCAGRAAVEVTHVVEFDEKNRPVLKPEFVNAMPPSSHWGTS